MASVKFGDILKCYKNVTETGDFEKWLERVETVARLQKVTDLQDFIPLFLAGESFDIYNQLSAADKKESKAVIKALKTAFCPNQFQAYEELRRRTWNSGESVDAYLSDLRRLMVLAEVDGNLDRPLKSAFMCGLPPDVKTQLLSMADAVSMSLADLVGRARVALSVATNEVVAAGLGRGPRFPRQIPSTPLKCFKCQGTGHKSSQCMNRCWGGLSAGGLPSYEAVNRRPTPILPVVNVSLGGRTLQALVDTGCTITLLSTKAVACLGVRPVPSMLRVCMLNGANTSCNGVVGMRMTVGKKVVDADFVVAEQLVSGFDVILGLDSIQALGGVYVCGSSVQFSNLPCVGAGVNGGSCSEALEGKGKLCGAVVQPIQVSECDFSAVFGDGKWTVRWVWKEGEPVLENSRGEYNVKKELRADYEKEVEQWIVDGWLEPHDVMRHGEVAGVIPLMAVSQPQKNKVRPVMDYRELNVYVESNPGRDAAVCDEKLREWRKMGSNVCLLDLKKAYLQLHVADDLLRFQAVKYKDRLYVMTRMGFGLNVAPKIMSNVLKKVLSLDPRVSAATDSYIDDIIVNTDIVRPEHVREHLSKYGLLTKDPVPLSGARVLGLRVMNQGDAFVWTRDGQPPHVQNAPVSRRELFSVCGQLVGHYPVAQWLRVACSFLKREATMCTNDWDASVSEDVVSMLNEVLQRVSSNDPVHGQWCVSQSRKGSVWCDASCLALGVCVDVDGVIAEDACWLRKKGDSSHINVAELEAVVKGINLAITWGLRDIKIMCDSATVCGWLLSVIADSHRPRVSGLSEMLVKRRLGIVAELMDAYGLTLHVVPVPSADNKADALTRVSRKWLHGKAKDEFVGAAAIQPKECEFTEDSVRELHRLHHFGIDKTLFLAREAMGSGVTKDLVRSVVATCEECCSIDPAPIRWDKGKLSVLSTWGRLATDVVHVRGVPYLSVVDCGPSRFAIWRKLTRETGAAVAANMEQIFRERGPPAEVLSDNGPCFRSHEFSSLLQRWLVGQLFSCAYRPSGNGIVERHHRTIKRMVARTGKLAEEMVLWYNNVPNDEGIVPSIGVHAYSVRLPNVPPVMHATDVTTANPYKVDDVVYVKPRANTCMTSWDRQRVTAVPSGTSVEVCGVPRHIADVRLAERGVSDNNLNCDLQSSQSEDDTAHVRWFLEETARDEDSEEEDNQDLRRTSRQSHVPTRYGHYYTH